MFTKIKEKFAEVKASNLTQDQKNIQYGELMTQLEFSYKIPMLKADLVDANIPDEVIELYEEISDARDLSIYE